MPDLLHHRGACAPGYGEAVVLSGMSLSLPESQALALLGRNGTGKTTLINSIVGITRPLRRHGQPWWGLTSRPCGRTSGARAGIGWVPQERNIFRSLTVEENMTAVAQPGPWDGGKGFTKCFPAPERAPQQFRQPAFRRRASRCWAIGRALDAQSQSAAAGRADRGARADHRRRNCSGRSAPSTRFGGHLLDYC